MRLEQKWKSVLMNVVEERKLEVENSLRRSLVLIRVFEAGMSVVMGSERVGKKLKGWS